MNDSARVAGPPRAGTARAPSGRASAARAALLATPGRRASTAAVLIASTAAFVTLVPVFRHFFDAGVYYGTVDQWVHHGGHIYDYVRPGSHYGFTYPPFAALVMAPMAVVSWPVVVAVACTLSVLASCLLLYWLLGDAVRRGARRPWLAYTVIGCLFAVLEPVGDTFSFGQVNLALVALVFADARLLATRRGRYAGIGTGLAAAVKLTPALFIGYLLVTGRRRQAAIAAATAGAATLLAAAVDPGASRTYWTGALFDTGRVGRLAFISNQSMQGVLARLGPGFTGHAAWLLCVAAVLAVWFRRSRIAAAAGDDRAGFALTGLAACLVSPVTWVHHLVWAVPALAVLADTGLRRGGRGTLAVCGALHVLLSSYVIWLWEADGTTGAVAFVGGNTYAWITLGLLVALPLPDPATVASTARKPGTHGLAEGSLSAGEASR